MSKPLQIRPMLAAQKFDLETTKQHLASDGYLLMQPKIDGFRYLFDDGIARSRSWKAWKHRAVQAFAKDHADLVHGWDGEGTPGHSYDAEIFRRAMSDLRAEYGATQFTFWLFDNFDPSWAHYPYTARRESNIRDLFGLSSTTEVTDLYYNTWDTPERYFEGLTPLGTIKIYDVRVKLCPTFAVQSIEEIEGLYEQMLRDGWEGAILRRKGRGYKWNRATTKEGALTKLKPEHSFEAVIEGTYARERNDNEAIINELGYTTRSAHKANKVAEDTLGGFHCHILGRPEVKFDCGILRLDDGQKKALWQKREKLVGQTFECTSHGYSGGYDKPRCAVFVRFRDPTEL